MPITFWTFSILRAMWHSRRIMKPVPKICMQPINDGAKTTQKTHCPKRASQTSSARTQNATIWSRSITCTSAVGSDAEDIWAFMFCSHLWNCNETSKPSVRAFMRSGSGAAVGTKERTNAKNPSSFFIVRLRGRSKIRTSQSMVVQTVKNTTISRTGCANSEKHYHKQNTNHYSVIYRMVMVVCGKVAIFAVSFASPPNGKVDGVLLRTVLHKRSSERFLRSN